VLMVTVKLMLKSASSPDSGPAGLHPGYIEICSRIMHARSVGRPGLVQGYLGERNLPVVFVAGLDTPALYGTAQAVVKVGQFTVEIGDHHQVQRGGIGTLELDPQVEQLLTVAFFAGAFLHVASQQFRDAADAFPLQVIADPDGFLQAEIARQVERRLPEEISGRIGAVRPAARHQLHQLLGNPRTPFNLVVTKQGRVLWAHLGIIEDMNAFLATLKKLAAE